MKFMDCATKKEFSALMFTSGLAGWCGDHGQELGESNGQRSIIGAHPHEALAATAKQALHGTPGTACCPAMPPPRPAHRAIG
jgi:hypothetical protein